MILTLIAWLITIVSVGGIAVGGYRAIRTEPFLIAIPAFGLILILIGALLGWAWHRVGLI